MARNDQYARASLPITDPLYAPGIQRRARAKGQDARYWQAPPKDARAGFKPARVLLDAGLTEIDAAAECREHWRALEEWRAVGAPSTVAKHSVAWLVDRYLSDASSPYQRIKGFASKRVYRYDMQTLRTEIGETMITRSSRAPIGADVIWRWHDEWAKDGKPARARNLIARLRTLVRYGASIPISGAAELDTVLKNMRFPIPPPRAIAPDRAMVMAIVGKALEFGLRSIAITTLAQFLLVERRISIIGAWEGKQWRHGWTWGDIDANWVIRYQQRKKGIVNREYDLKDTPMLLELLQLTPPDQRIGPIILNERTGKQWVARRYTRAFQRICKAAGIPDGLWSMDMRAGGATEADNIAEINERDLKAAGGWKSNVFNRYTRKPQQRAQNVVKLREAAAKK